MATRTITLGAPLSIEDIQATAERHATFILSDSAKECMRASHASLTRLTRDQIVYGVNTGFGPMANTFITPAEQNTLQYNLVRSHACGIGQPLAPELVRAIMLTRTQTLAQGYSGVTPDVVLQLLAFLTHDILPIIPEHGSVGASGDLVQLAHVAEALIGEGQVVFEGATVPTATALKQVGLTPLTLTGRDGLALINGTAAMTGVAAYTLSEAERLVTHTLTHTALIYHLFGVSAEHIHPLVADVRPHPGQQAVQARLRALLDIGVEQVAEARPQPQNQTTATVALDRLPQAIYSLRCVPQILGPIMDRLKTARQVVTTELNSVTDNPLIDPVHGAIHNGNFHGDYVALEMDATRIAITKLSMLLERQLNFISNPRLNELLPPYGSAGTPGLDLAFQATQFVATSTTALNQTLATPIYTHSISTNNDNQDIVSLGCDSALLTRTVVLNTYTVLSILSAQVLQAVDLLKTGTMLPSLLQQYYRDARTVFPLVIKDVALKEPLEALALWLRHIEL